MKKQPVRIAHIIGKWVGGGVEAVVMNYYRHIDRTKIQFDFICDSDSTNIPYEEIEKLGGKVILIPPYQKVFQYQKKLKKVFKEGNYKIVHSHINTLSVFPLRVAKKVGIPVRIAHSHSTTNKKEWKKNLLKQILRPFAKVYPTHYFACSELAGRWQFGNKEFDRGNVYLLNNAIDIEKFRYNEDIRKKKRKELKIKDEFIVIGHVGRFVTVKNHTFLIDVFDAVHKKNKNTILLLAGQGPLEEEIKEKVRKLNLQKSVIFLGHRIDANELYQAFDVFLLPSLYEGLPVVGVEAQASGLICILSDNITSQTKIIDSSKFLSITSEDYTKWTEEIFLSLKQNTRKDTYEKMTSKNYNIKVEAKKLEKYYMDKIENINNIKIGNYLLDKDYVSFDLFDTLIYRVCGNPLNLFDLVEKYYNLTNDSKIIGFKMDRVNAEKKARKNSKKEISIDEIYKFLTPKYTYNQTELLKKIEKSIEIKCCKLNLKFYEFYRYALKNNKKILITTDMYLDRNTIEQILKKNDIKYDFLFLSSEIGLKKSNGLLFKNILDEIKINPSQIIHFGDNFKSDYLMPRKYGIKSFRFTNSNFNNKTDNLDLFLLNNLIDNNLIGSQKNDYYRFGYRNLGPLMYGFCDYLRQNIDIRKHIYFFAREGQFIQKCFNIIDDKHNSSYLYFSRKSITNSIIHYDNVSANVINAQSIMQNETVITFFKRINLDFEANAELLRKNKIYSYSIVDENIKSFIIENIKLLLSNSKITSNKLLDKYLEQYDFNNSVIVDIGWNGTMQDLLQLYFDEKKLKLEGYYLGVRNSRKNKYKHGYIFDGFDLESEKQSRSMVGLLEILFSADHGTTVDYKHGYNKIVPVLLENDLNEEIMNKITYIQSGAMDFIKDFINSELTEIIDMNANVSKYNLFEVGLHPTSKDIGLFEKFLVYDEKLSSLISEKNLLHYLLHPKSFINDYISCSWKNAFLKKLLKINLNYYKIFEISYRIKERK